MVIPTPKGPIISPTPKEIIIITYKIDYYCSSQRRVFIPTPKGIEFNCSSQRSVPIPTPMGLIIIVQVRGVFQFQHPRN